MKTERPATYQRITRAISVGVFLVLVWSLISVFKVKQIECKVGSLKLDEAICARFNHLHGKSLFFTQFSDALILEQVMNDPQVSSSYQLVKLQKVLPSTLVITLLNEPPLYRLKPPEGDASLVGSDGKFKIDVPSAEVPTVTITAAWEAEVGEYNQETHQQLVALLKAFEQEVISLKEVSLQSSSTLVITLNSGMVVLVEKTAPADTVARRLNAVLKNFDLHQYEEPIQEIDLRFTMPVLRTNKTTL